MTAFQYAVLQYMPDPARQERVNVGVVVAIPGSGSAEVRMLKRADAARLKWLGAKDDIKFLDDLAEDLSHPHVPEGGSVADALVRAHTDWGGAIRVSALRAAVHDDAHDLCEELYARYVAGPRARRRPAYRVIRLLRKLRLRTSLVAVLAVLAAAGCSTAGRPAPVVTVTRTVTAKAVPVKTAVRAVPGPAVTVTQVAARDSTITCYPYGGKVYLESPGAGAGAVPGCSVSITDVPPMSSGEVELTVTAPGGLSSTWILPSG